MLASNDSGTKRPFLGQLPATTSSWADAVKVVEKPWVEDDQRGPVIGVIEAHETGSFAIFGTL
jgi:hypothetical protein